MNDLKSQIMYISSRVVNTYTHTGTDTDIEKQ